MRFLSLLWFLVVYSGLNNAFLCVKGSQCSIEIILSCIFDSLIIKYIGGAVYLFQFYYFLRDGDTFAWNTDFYSEYCFMGPSFAVYFWEPDDFFKVFLESFHSFAVTWSSKHKMCEGFFFQPKMHEKVQSLESMALSNMQTIKK